MESKSKVGSTDNMKHKPGGGNVKVGPGRREEGRLVNPEIQGSSYLMGQRFSACIVLVKLDYIYGWDT